MEAGEWALIVSGFSLATAISGFIWNIWSKFIFVRPDVSVTFNIITVFRGGKFGKTLCSLNVTNMGPGPLIVHMCVVKSRGEHPWKPKLGFINPIHGDPTVPSPQSIGPFSDGLPLKLDVGENKSFYFPFGKACILEEQDLLAIGVNDTFNRNTWCRRRDVKRAQQRYAKELDGAPRGPDLAP